MGIIQNALNQAMTTIGVAARLSPEYEAKTAEYKEKQGFKTFEALASSELGNENYQEEKAERLDKIASIRPTQKNISAAIKAGEELGAERAAIFKQKQANQKADQIQEAQKQQKERYETFVKVFTEGGLYK